MAPSREPAPKECVSALVIGKCDSLTSALAPIFRQTGWKLMSARDAGRAMQYLAHNHVQVVITAADRGEPDWREVLASALQLPEPPMVVVTARIADEYLWAEVLNRGGYDVLAQPFDPEEVRRVISSAHRHFAPRPKCVKSAAAASNAA